MPSATTTAGTRRRARPPVPAPPPRAGLVAAGTAVPAHRLVSTPDEVDDDLCAALGAEEVVAKVSSPGLLHKSDVGGVLHCRNEAKVLRSAVARVLEAARTGAPSARVVGALVAERGRYTSGGGREGLAGLPPA